MRRIFAAGFGSVVGFPVIFKKANRVPVRDASCYLQGAILMEQGFLVAGKAGPVLGCVSSKWKSKTLIIIKRAVGAAGKCSNSSKSQFRKKRDTHKLGAGVQARRAGRMFFEVDRSENCKLSPISYLQDKSGRGGRGRPDLGKSAV